MKILIVMETTVEIIIVLIVIIIAKIIIMRIMFFTNFVNGSNSNTQMIVMINRDNIDDKCIVV